MKKKRISSLILSLTILISSISGLTVTSSAVEPVNRLTQSYKNTEYSNMIVPADTIPSGSGYQQVEYIVSNSADNPINFTLSSIATPFVDGNFILSDSSRFRLVNKTNLYGATLDLNFATSSMTVINAANTFTTLPTLYTPINFSFLYAYSRSSSGNFDRNGIGSALFVNGSVLESKYRSNSYNRNNNFGVANNDIFIYNSSIFSVDFYNPSGASISFQNYEGPNGYTWRVSGFNFPQNFSSLNKGYILVPCYRTSDGNLGFYNLLNNSFIELTSQTGIYAGPDVVGVTEPTILDQSSDYSIYLTGASPELYINATTEIGNITYQWQRSNPSPLGYTDWTDIENATEQFYTPPAFDDLGIYKFRCKVGSVLGSSGLYIYSDDINIEVVEADPDIPVIVSQPESKVYYDTVQHLDNLFIEVAEMEEGQITYQWQYRDDNNIWRDVQGATSFTLNVDVRATHLGSYYYRCNVSNTLANVTKNVTSNVAEIKIIEYNSFEDFWRIFFNGGLGSISDVTAGIENITNNYPIDPGGSNQFIKMVGALYNSVVPYWFNTYIAVLLLCLGIIVVLRGAGF